MVVHQWTTVIHIASSGKAVILILSNISSFRKKGLKYHALPSGNLIPTATCIREEMCKNESIISTNSGTRRWITLCENNVYNYTMYVYSHVIHSHKISVKINVWSIRTLHNENINHSSWNDRSLAPNICKW